MKELTDEQIVAKWGPVIEGTTQLRGEDSKKAAIFAHHYAIMESNKRTPFSSGLMTSTRDTGVRNPFDSLLALNLRVIEKIKDLSNVVFIQQPVQNVSKPKVERDENGNIFLNKNEQFVVSSDYRGKFKVEKDAIYSGLPHGIDWIGEVETSITMMIAKKINELLDEGGTLYIYAPVADIILIDNYPDPSFEVVYLSRMERKDTNNVSMDDI